MPSVYVLKDVETAHSLLQQVSNSSIFVKSLLYSRSGRSSQLFASVSLLPNESVTAVAAQSFSNNLVVTLLAFLHRRLPKLRRSSVSVHTLDHCDSVRCGFLYLLQGLFWQIFEYSKVFDKSSQRRFNSVNEKQDHNKVAVIQEEKDLLLQLQAPSFTTSVISPQPIRPVGSSITVGCISENTSLNPAVQVPKKPEEVEEEVQSETLPAIISDSNNKVRMANSAYKEMVGQPECSWLDCMETNNDGKLGDHSCKRICGEVMLRFCDSNKVPAISSSSNGFSCWVRIEWGSVGN
ncbi:hypothetical protein Q3G72_010290 [Acer saccharum]|nr:hypothetical protein Q3G72_010290 [Acer saccharum]